MKILNMSLVLGLRGAVLACLATVPLIHAQTIWNGPPVSESDANQPDQITPNVWLTRGGSQGLYNAVTESGFIHTYSPADTEWADGTTADPNLTSLPYTDWNTWVKGVHSGPPSTVGVNAVVHLISDDIYINITFTSWQSRGGGYSYQRSTPAAVVNNPPSMTITNPTNGMVFAAPANVTMQVSVTNGTGSVTNVQFRVGSTILTNAPAAPFSATTNNLPAGSYTLTAIAMDNLGLTATNSTTISVVTPVQATFGGLQSFRSTNFQFSYAANLGLSYIIQRATNLAAASWITLATNTAASNPVVFVDNNATNSPGFYRVGRLPNP
jgi:hypothetical protein